MGYEVALLVPRKPVQWEALALLMVLSPPVLTLHPRNAAYTWPTLQVRRGQVAMVPKLCRWYECTAVIASR